MSDRPTEPPERLTLFYCPACGFTTASRYGCLIPANGHCDSPKRDVYEYELIKETVDV